MHFGYPDTSRRGRTESFRKGASRKGKVDSGSRHRAEGNADIIPGRPQTHSKHAPGCLLSAPDFQEKPVRLLYVVSVQEEVPSTARGETFHPENVYLNGSD